uniref:Ion transport domain-containing protein n=1 Tax=Ascaris lumbricoides TaxID=6252 RepID=A0A9J2Q2I3_ASCLU
MIVRVKNAIAAFSLRGPKVAPIAAKIQERHLELEPLCCLSSCLVRGGCFAIVGLEATYVLITLIMIALRLYNGGQLHRLLEVTLCNYIFRLWSEFEPNFISIVTHQLFLYVIVAFDMVSFSDHMVTPIDAFFFSRANFTMMIVMILAMIRGLLRFNKELMRLHWFFDFFSLGFNIFAFLIYVPALSIAGAHQWNAIDVIIVLCITMQIPLQPLLAYLASVSHVTPVTYRNVECAMEPTR